MVVPSETPSLCRRTHHSYRLCAVRCSGNSNPAPPLLRDTLLTHKQPGIWKQKRPGMFYHAGPPFSKFVNLFQPERYKQRFIDLPIDLQSIVGLIMGNCAARTPADVTIDRATIIPLLRQACLNIGSNRSARVVTRPGADIDNQPAAIVPTVIMVSPAMVNMLIPITVTAGRKPAAVIVIALIALDCERRSLLPA